MLKYIEMSIYLIFKNIFEQFVLLCTVAKVWLYLNNN